MEIRKGVKEKVSKYMIITALLRGKKLGLALKQIVPGCRHRGGDTRKSIKYWRRGKKAAKNYHDNRLTALCRRDGAVGSSGFSQMMSISVHGTRGLGSRNL